jgi:hypothetical protein
MLVVVCWWNVCVWVVVVVVMVMCFPIILQGSLGAFDN